MGAHFSLDVDPIGHGSIVVNGHDVTSLTEGADVIVRPGQLPTTLRLYVAAGAHIEGDGVVEVHTPADTSDVGDFLRGLDAADLWEQMFADPAADLSDPAAELLRRVADLVDPRP